MTFKNADTERRFVEMHADMLAQNVFRGGLACTGASLVVMLSLLTRELTSVRSEDTWRLNFATAATCVGTSAAVAAAVKMPCGLKLLTPQRREVAVMAMVFILAALQFGIDPWYGAKILQHEPDLPGCQQNFSDTRPVLVLSALVLASHLALPIRWICLLPLEVALGLLYPGFAFILGGPDGVHAWSTCLLLLGLISCAIVGRRTIEDHQRQTFTTIIKERSLRAQSEFKLEQGQDSLLDAGSAVESRQGSSEGQSRPETTPSCLAFKAYNGVRGAVNFKKLIDLGYREQWYVHRHEVTLHNKVLGQGSYGLVVAGEYHGSPVAVKANKASNIIAEYIPGLNRFHRVKLLDFGLARALTRHALSLGGSLAWMAPELVLHPGSRPDVSADVYSYGRVAYFTLTGIAALGEMTAEEITTRMRMEALPAQAWPRHLDPSLMRCWVCVEPCVSFWASLRPKMETVGCFFESAIEEPSSEDASSRGDGESDGPILGSSDQEVGSSAPGVGSSALVSSDRSHSPAAATSILPGTLEGGGDGDGGGLLLPAARGRHFPVLPGEGFQSAP